MGFWKTLIEKAKKSLKYSVVDPVSFEEVWSFTSTRIRVLSLGLLLILLLGIGMTFLFSMFGAGPGVNDTSIERKQLEAQYKQIEILSEHVKKQERYIIAQSRILKGEVPVNVHMDSLVKATSVRTDFMEIKPSKAERKISKEVRDDMRTNTTTESAIPYFKPPVLGVMSDGFDAKSHPGVDIVTNENATIKACLSGTVIYSGFTRSDGFILILDHGNGYMSIYKHARKSLKNAGAKVRLGDPIAIVGNTGENSDGPHLHFELWYNQRPVNPSDYLSFKK